MSIYSSYACTTIIPRATALQFLIGNRNTETLESVHGEVQSVDCLVFAPQQNRSKITSILISEGNQDNQRNADVPAEQSTAPRTGMVRVGAINNIGDFKSLLINTINQVHMLVATEAMKATGSPHLLTAFALEVLGIMDHNFDSWREEMDGGRWIHALLLQFWDNITASYGVYATDFQNGNFYETKRPASATDKSAFDKAVLNLKALRDHFRQRIAVKQACNAKPAIAYLMKDATARPA